MNKSRWNIRLAMFDRVFRVFMAGQQKKYIQEFNEWIQFFRNNMSPDARQEIKKVKIVKHPYTEGFKVAMKYHSRRILKAAVPKLLR